MIHAGLSFGFPLTEATARERDNLQKRVDAYNDEVAAIGQAEAELKATPSADWKESHTKAMQLLKNRKLSAVHSEIAIRESIGELYKTVLNVDHPAARDASRLAALDAKQKATSYLVAGGWVLEKGESGPLPIDLHVLIRNTDFCQATTTEQTVGNASWRESRMANEKAIELAKEQLDKAKERALAV